MRKFDTKVQDLKYRVLREVARQAWDDRLAETAIDIPKKIVPGKRPPCVAVSTRNAPYLPSV